MKKIGFTLAEVLITLGIIGVVAALTLPNLQTDVIQRQVGPKLAKAVSSFEQASEALLNDKMADSLVDAELIATSGSPSTYVSQLTNFLKGTVSANTITTKDGVSFTISGTKPASTANVWGGEANFGTLSSTAHPHKNYVGSVRIDINGIGKTPDAAAEDQFYFTLFDDGSLRPIGFGDWNESGNTNSYSGKCDKTNNSNKLYCSGYIFDNNLKADFKLD